MYRSGRHFLQILGPTNVPDRVSRAIDGPTIDRRGPDFAERWSIKLSATPGSIRRPAPLLGEHTDEILAELR